MSYLFSRRMENVRLSLIRQVMQRADRCVNLGLGEPDFFAPGVVRRAAEKVLENEKIGYSATRGWPPLCQAVLEYHGLDGGDGDVCITNGSQEALFDVLFVLLDEGDEVLVPNPGYVAYPTVVRLAGGHPVEYRLPRRSGFGLSLTELAAALSPRTRVLILNSPSNPTGRVVDAEHLGRVIQWAEKEGLVVISDEIYREIYYTENPPPTAAACSRQVITLSGVSKMASMTGWRLGWACGPREILEKVTAAHQYVCGSASTLAQKAGVAVFTQEGRRAVARLRGTLRGNRDFLCEWLEENLGLPHVVPEGSFYCMLSVEHLSSDSLAVALDLLTDRVATIPGAAFGSEAEGFLRLSFACPRRRLRTGLERLKAGLQRMNC